MKHKYAEVIHAFAEGNAVQWKNPDDMHPNWHDVECPNFNDLLEWRIKPSEFPAPPEGQQWFNPDGLTPEQVCVDDGWRLFLVGDTSSEWEYWDHGIWNKQPPNTVGRSDALSINATCTRRTKCPLPEPKKLPEKQPYSQESWNFEWVRNLLFTKDHAHVLGVTEMGITVLDEGIVKVVTWDTLMTMEGSNDRVNWVPLYR